MPKSCYFCGKEATTDEHVPPKCIFPTQKDANGTDYRKNLITVPACEKHNGEKSKDDEYLMMVLAAHFENNSAAKNQVATKIFRSWQLNPNFAKQVVKNPTQIIIDGIARIGFELDSMKFSQILEWAAHALYFHEFKLRPTYEFKMISAPIFKVEGNDANFINNTRINLLLAAELLFKNAPKLGENQEVFWYQLTPQTDGISTMRMCFYEGFPVILMSSPSLDK